MVESGSAAELAFDDVRLSTSRPVRLVYGGVGFVFLVVGILGWVIPGIPGTLNLLAALFFFSRSSERMYRWMLTNRYFGSTLRDYKAGLGIPRRIKVIAVVSIVAAVTWSAGFVIEALWLRAALVGLGAYGVYFVASKPTREIELARRGA